MLRCGVNIGLSFACGKVNLLFSFELCLLDPLNMLVCYKCELAIFFWIMLSKFLLRIPLLESYTPCYFLLNYAGEGWTASVEAWDARLAIFFWIMRYRELTRYIVQRYTWLAIFFWIMRTTQSDVVDRAINLLACYFLLNYAEKGYYCNYLCWSYEDLLFSFELCTTVTVMSRPAWPEINLLFSFELCSH